MNEETNVVVDETVAPVETENVAEKTVDDLNAAPVEVAPVGEAPNGEHQIGEYAPKQEETEVAPEA